jgi:hypothetical protein
VLAAKKFIQQNVAVMKDSYKSPVLHRLGGIAEITGTGGCWDLDGDGDGKRLSWSGDVLWGYFIPILEDCSTGS